MNQCHTKNIKKWMNKWHTKFLLDSVDTAHHTIPSSCATTEDKCTRLVHSSHRTPGGNRWNGSVGCPSPGTPIWTRFLSDLVVVIKLKCLCVLWSMSRELSWPKMCSLLLRVIFPRLRGWECLKQDLFDQYRLQEAWKIHTLWKGISSEVSDKRDKRGH